MSVKVNVLLSSLRAVWSDVMPLSSGIGFTMQESLEDRVSELEQENRLLREQLAQLGAWSGTGEAMEQTPACRI